MEELKGLESELTDNPELQEVVHNIRKAVSTSRTANLYVPITLYRVGA